MIKTLILLLNLLFTCGYSNLDAFNLGIEIQESFLKEKKVKSVNELEPSKLSINEGSINGSINSNLPHFDCLECDAELENTLTIPIFYPDPILTSNQPIEIDWRVLMDIEFKPKYFEELELELNAPIFTKKIKKLDGVEVRVKGFVIPIDEEGDILSLSYYPFASCFFCGNAAPTSVMTLYLKDESKRYKLDDLKVFKGTFSLNYDNPNEFYYVLRDAVEVK